jgi:ferredoxin-NADP reductase
MSSMPPLVAHRLLRSSLIDVLVGPHGIDRYLELIRPALTVNEARASVQAVRRQTARSVTLTLRPNAAFQGFRAGQFVRVGVEIDGVRRTRCYSPACSERADLLELTVTTHPDGLVSRWLRERLVPGTIVHLGEASGSFVLPDPRPERLALISGGSGITPVLSMLRTLCEEGFDGELAFVHYARTRADWLYRLEVEAIAARHRGIRVAYVATREGGEHASAESLRRLIGEIDGATAMVCGPRSLIEGVRALWPGDLRSETFAPPSLELARAGERPAAGTIRFRRSGLTATIASGSLLEQAEAAGLSPEFGCRMGICRTCTCRKTAGAVRDLRTGEVSAEDDEDIQLCVSVPVGDVALEL